MLRAHSRCSLCPEAVEALLAVEVVQAAEVALGQLTFPVERAEQQEEEEVPPARVAILAREARVVTQEVPALQDQAVTPVALVDLVLEELLVLEATPVVPVVTQEEVPADPVLGVTQALELEDLALAVTLDLEAVGLVPVATLLEEDTALGQDQALVDKAESRLADFVVLLDQAVTAALVGREAPGVLEVLVVMVVPVAPVVLEALEDLVVTVVPVVPVAPEVQAGMVGRVVPVVLEDPEVPVVTVVRLVPVVPEVLVVTVARVVLEVLAGTAVRVAPEVLVDLGVLVVRKDQVDPRDQVGLEDPGVLVVLEAPAVMEAMEDPEEELELHLVALAHTWRVVVLVLGLIQVLVPRLPKAVHGLLPVDMVSFQLGPARRLRRIQVHQGPMPIRVQALVPVHQELVHNPEEVEHGRGLSTQAPLLAALEAAATTHPTAGRTRAVPDTPDRTRPASCQVALPKGLAEEVGVEGHRAVMGHL